MTTAPSGAARPAIHAIGGQFSSLTPLLAPRSIAVVGASSDPTRIGGRPIAYMKNQGFKGALYPVNPTRPEIQGLKAYASIADLPEPPDVAIVAVPAEIATQAVSDLAKLGVKGVVMFTAGFAEVDEAGERAQAGMIAEARKSGMRILGPNCLGVFDSRLGYYATFSSSFDSGWPVPGRIGIASQSGAYGTHLYTLARNRGIGASLCVMTGNEADVTVGECIGWLAENPEVDVIAVYAEGIREAPGLIAALTAAKASKKPIVMQKVGRSELGGKAAKSHTASIAGDDAVTEAVMAEFGVFRARNSEEMLDIAHTATRKIYPVRNTLGVITVSGGAGVLISDVAEGLGLEMPEMPQDAQDKLRALIPFCAPRNPVDATAQVTNDITLVNTFTESMVRDGGYASVLGFFSMTASSKRWPAIREQLNPVMKAASPGGRSPISTPTPTGCMCSRSSFRRKNGMRWKPMAGSCMRTRPAPSSRSTPWAAMAPPSPPRPPPLRLPCRRSPCPPPPRPKPRPSACSPRPASPPRRKPPAIPPKPPSPRPRASASRWS